jgi:NAD(P)-dependent dehydrogenase (short-subunit alcohol dehydrogenase family)
VSMTAVVTGTASGMGQAAARLLLEAGWTVLALDRSPSALADGPGEVFEFEVDVTDRSQVGAAIEAALPPGQSIDLVANIAGIYPPSTLADFTCAQFRRIFDVNVLGVLNVVAEASAHLRAGSSIVNFASVDAFTVSPGQLLYGASKAAVVMLTKALALELAPRGVRVNAIAPGWVDTPGNDATGRMASVAATVPLGRVAHPEEIARWVLLLAGRDAAYMTGETVVLSGGGVLR